MKIKTFMSLFFFTLGDNFLHFFIFTELCMSLLEVNFPVALNKTFAFTVLCV
jgi:hypothetical protein